MTWFEVWAPNADSVQVAVGSRDDLVRYPLRPLGGRPSGRWGADVPGAGHGTDYGFILDDGEALPDPRSPWQPHGVHGLSRVYEHDRFSWTDQRWRGRPLRGSVLYELHVGTFTPDGTLDAACERLDHLVSLGVDAVELMPVAAFPGKHGWGYDGVHLWAVHEPYGGPDALKRFVDTAHALGLAVILDVVYNHLGPSGNYLPRYGPYFTDAYSTPWGSAVNFDQAGADEVRAFVVENALMWLRDYHVDGLRLDAVHAINDRQAVHVLEELAVAVRGLSAHLGRELFLVAESDLNDPRLVTPRETGGYGLDAQWSDDYHHAMHAALTGERQGYYCDFGSLDTLAKALTNVFVHDGTWSTYRERRHGRPVDVLRTPADRFVCFLQNHDQIGNRASGDRLAASLPPGLLKVGAALLLLAPFTPMLFMGEEWGATTPWCYFTDHVEPELARAVSEGRRREFARHGWSGTVPDPQAVETFRESVLDWDEIHKAHHPDLLEWHRSLIALRRAWPELTDPRLTEVHVETAGRDAGKHRDTGEHRDAVRHGDADEPEDTGERWILLRRGRVCMAANLGTRPVEVELPPSRLLLASDPDVHLDESAVTGADEGRPPAPSARLTLPATSVAIAASPIVRPPRTRDR